MGAKGGREVYDFLLSVDYGVCHGPVDSLNQVVVKDKPILCGRYTERTDIPVYQPDLFGGDDAEGGVVGMVEFFTGAYDQVASETLAARPGRTVDTMPGYRGICHLFFRGFGNNGFRWTTNNPYFPETKVNVTRLPKTLGEANKRIDGIIDVAEPVDPENSTFFDWFINPTADMLFGNLFPEEFTDSTTLEPIGENNWVSGSMSTKPLDEWTSTRGDIAVVDGVISAGNFSFNIARDFLLADLGITDDMVDLGEVQVEITFRAATDGVNSGTTTVAVTSYNEAAVASVPWGSNPLLVQDSIAVVSGGDPQSATITGTMPTGTRAFRVQATCLNGPWVHLESMIVRWKEAEPWHCTPDGSLAGLPDANPAHIIHECQVNTDWGKGENPALIDTASYEAAAATLYSENFGLSMIYVRQNPIEDFIQEVLDHIRGFLFQHPATGLWTLKLLRDDYDVGSLRTLDPSNCKATKRKRRAWGEIINEIVVSYTDADSEEDATVTAHDAASISIQGGIVSETRDYYGIRNEYLAGAVAERDVREASYPLFSCTVKADRSFSDVIPGDVLLLDWPDDGITGMVVRVMEVDRGKPRDREITMQVVEDIFSVDQAQYSPAQNSLWADDRVAPAPLDAEAAITAPLPVMVRNGLTVAEIDTDYPAVRAQLLGDADGVEPRDIEAHAPVTRTDGSTSVEAVVTMPITRSTTLATALAEEATSTIPGSLVSEISVALAEAGDILMLGTNEATSELILLTSYDSVGDTWTVARGIWDTVPRAWPVGSRVWYYPDGYLRADPAERAAGETTVYRLLPRTRMGRLGYGAANDLSYTATERPFLPFRPADCDLDGAGFGILQAGAVPTTITATWANRDRAMEDQVAARWTGATVTPETGQTTVLRILDDTGAVQNELTGLTGTSRAITAAELSGVLYGAVEFLSERDGMRSLQGARRWFDFRAGYGFDYGNNYGGA